MIEIKGVHNSDEVLQLGVEKVFLDRRLRAFGREQEEMLTLLFFAVREGRDTGYMRGDLVAQVIKSFTRLLRYRFGSRKRKLVKCYRELLRVIVLSDNIQLDMVKYLNQVMGISLTRMFPKSLEVSLA